MSSPLADATLETVRDRWAGLLDCQPGPLREAAPAVLGWEREAVEFLFPIDAGPVVAAPAALVDRLRRRTDRIAALEAADDPAFERLLGRPVEALGPADRGALSAFRAACPDRDLDRVGAFDPAATVGRFRDGRLIAAASTDRESGVAGVSVLVRPEWRGAGHGRAVVSAVVARALGDGLVAEYRTLEEWPASVGLARSLGFERYATSRLAVPRSE